MNEKRIQQIIEIEKQAQGILEAATQEAKDLPVQAERDAQTMIEKAHANAQEEARRMLANAQAEDETSKILSDAQRKTREAEAVASKNLDRAVAFVLDRVIGKA